ncbi:unnamed protein product [Brassica rapa]|uniref:Tryptophan synthase n=1 Tax=Brassica campestris TaxID=3711 RepID=A0A3P5ZG94_BRACM|nr:unnamed protein product [Brassica rapa]VDC75275.1 unnamed protein product [Brassica rapa]
MSYLLQDDDGQITEPHSISAGLDYPGVGPELSFLKDVGRAEYCRVTDEEALEVSRLEGIIPALETCTCIGSSGEALSEVTRWNQSGLELQWERG